MIPRIIHSVASSRRHSCTRAELKGSSREVNLGEVLLLHFIPIPGIQHGKADEVTAGGMQ